MLNACGTRAVSVVTYERNSLYRLIVELKLNFPLIVASIFDWFQIDFGKPGCPLLFLKEKENGIRKLVPAAIRPTVWFFFK
jgi:hypothetical protein